MESVPGPGRALIPAGWDSVEPLGDQGLLARFSREETALAWAQAARAQLPFEVVPAYRTVAVFASLTDHDFAQLKSKLAAIPPATDLQGGRQVTIPCCYALGPDLAETAQALGLTSNQLIDLHAGHPYQVFAIGFVPGFPYMGWLPDPLAGLDRLPSPRVRVPAGSVGITGKQTGIYPAEVPGGWRLIGRTPCQLACLEEGDHGWFALRPGDTVRFQPIRESDFTRLKGSRPQADSTA